LIALLTLFASTWYARTAWTSHAASTTDERINVAAAVNGGVALASSTKDDAIFPASSVINGDRNGIGFGVDGGWVDGTPGEFPDTMEVEFSDVFSIDEIDVVTTQDTWWNPVEPTEALDFFNNGITAFEVEYFDGRNWLAIPGGSVTGNTKVLRKFTFSPVTAEKIRVKIKASRSTYSMLIELEAYGVPAAAPSPSPTPSPLPTPSGDLNAALAERDIYIDGNNHIGFGTPNPIFNDDGTTGAFVGKWVAIDGKVPGAAAYLGLGGTIPQVNERVGALNFYNLAMGGADNRTAAIFSFNGPKLGTGTLEFYTSPNFIGPVRRMQIAPTGEVGINHPAAPGTMLQVMGKTTDASAHALGILNAADRPLLTVRNDGQVSVSQPGQGIVLKSPNGQVCRKLAIDDSGNLVVKPLASCP
jgi:hypothetical protein